MNIFIYGLRELSAGTIDYVGQTAKPKMRLAAHRSRFGQFGRVPFNYELVILEKTTKTKANQRESHHFGRLRARGQCRLNGKRFCRYPLRDAKRVRELRQIQERIGPPISYQTCVLAHAVQSLKRKKS